MMLGVRKLSLIVSASAAVGLLGLALAPGCRDATQVTVDISLTKRASCTETNGTAITVGTEPAMTQQRVADEFVTATTNACTEATHEIGTLVVTPGGNGRGSVIVVVAYDKTIVPSSCKPPLFKGCIVARRQFTFNDHQHVRLPITIDPDCKDVPCDAFSTCRTGKCFSSDVSCTDDSCLEPGDPGDGGTSLDGQVIPDTGVDSPVEGGGLDGGGLDGAGNDATLDAPIDGPPTDGAIGTDGSTPGGVACMGGVLQCPAPATPCNGTLQSCCGPTVGGPATCNAGVSTCGLGMKKYCCSDLDCVMPQTCFQGVAGPLPPGPLPPPAPNPLTPGGTCQ
jgi:hypothetical protein